MDLLTELKYDDCVARLTERSVGRVALTTPDGPTIIPVNYVVDDASIVIRTAPYSVLGTHGRGTEVAFEVDHLDDDARTGWSVVAVGRLATVESAVEVARFRAGEGPRPWAGGSRMLHLRLPWRSLTGREVG